MTDTTDPISDVKTATDLIDALEKALGKGRTEIPGAMSKQDAAIVCATTAIGVEDGTVRLESFPVSDTEALTAYGKFDPSTGTLTPLIYFPTQGLMDILGEALGADEDGMVDRRDTEQR